MLKQTCPVSFILLLVCGIVFIQPSNCQKQDDSNPQAQVIIERQQQVDFSNRVKALRDLMNTPDRIASEGNVLLRRSNPRPNLSPEELAELKEKEEDILKLKAALLPPPPYYSKYENLLKNKNTHLARIFIDRKCDQGKIVSIPELRRCAEVVPVKGGGSLYSFRLKNNAGLGENWWDIHFANGRLLAGNETVQTLISEIGEIDLSSLKIKSPAFKFLNDYEPKDSIEAIKQQNRILKKGVSLNGFIYSNSAPAKLNATYVLRSVAYRLKGKDRRFNSGKQIDITVAFKIVGQETDGSLIVLWKEFKKALPRRELK